MEPFRTNPQDLPPAPPGLRHLNLVSRCVAGDDIILEHIRHSIGLGLPELGCALVRNNGDFVICGSGPSIEGEIEAIKAMHADGVTICALNDAHDWLIKHGVYPSMVLMLDPTEQMADRIAEAKEGVIYLIASQCHPKVFQKLGANIVLWHALANIGEEQILGERMRVGGGTTVGLRALCIGWLLGFHKFHLFGMDSSLVGNRLRITGENAKQANALEVICGDRKFMTNPAMAGQANDLSVAIGMFNGAIKIKAYGDGLLQHVLSERRRLGHVDW